MVPPPLNFPKWLAENRHLLQPPVGNFCLFRSDDYTVMAVGGPNARSDYHFQPTEEFFYQVQGAMLLKIVEDGEFKDVVIGEGEMFMLPANTPHSPVRFEGTVGLVVERTRPDDKDDALRWYCPKLESHPDGPHIVKESRFHCTDLGTQLKPVIDEWHRDEAGRKCSCGYAVGTRELIGRQTVA
ncbi:3-hydroxyanthranilate 3,4-dioxygenase 2 [Tilletiopsis washingtonensis]|uniref:3-hydroxyanthranilate 3,4-dioxygenase n=1 Tax=Tilletiopsis washingtonensis TaxID=58919 RepID=A0A316Z2N3_9BASI|nr:3-hydroxyanthranilate 3,4-dioxygenase 2 [Tilletiopsis washingtonensis]PWN95829.1 3-hydroxyanthranilate 3,4-dioxygenase 2 [Tilletiopsis washingtonensis]